MMHLPVQRLALHVLAFLAALAGNLAVQQYNNEDALSLPYDVPAIQAVPWWILAVVLLLEAMRPRPAVDTPVIDPVPPRETGVRLRWLAASLPYCIGAYFFSSGNQFRLLGVACWLLGVAMVVWAFAPRGVQPGASLRRGLATLAGFPRREPVAFVLLALIMAVAAYARFDGLDRVPAEISHDHIEKLIDVQRVLDGSRDVFFANNGGREPIQMYLIALFAAFGGGEVTFMHLKIASALESLLLIPVVFVLGRTVAGPHRRSFGTALGLTAALFAAVGVWDIIVTRASLRFMLTPLFSALLLIVLIRLLRYNRRADAIWAGLLLGGALYAYQSARYFPLIAVAAVLFIPVAARSFRAKLRSVVQTLCMIAAVAVAVSLPMIRYAVEYPDAFWERVLGALIEKPSAFDDPVTAAPEPLARLAARAPVFAGNVARLLGMFTYRGDTAWFQNAPGRPAFDVVTGALWMLGLAEWTVIAFRRRDRTAPFVVAAFVLLLLPSAFALAAPDDNPSHTRTAGAIPLAYLIAAFGALSLIESAAALVPKRAAVPFLAAAVAGLGAFALATSMMTVIGPYDLVYKVSWHPNNDAGQYMRQFVEGPGAWGNVFFLNAGVEVDYASVAVVAGAPPGKFPHGAIPVDHLLNRMLDGWLRTDEFRLDPDREILVFTPPPADFPTLLRMWFPYGVASIVRVTPDPRWPQQRGIGVYVIPPLGAARLRALLETQGLVVPNE